MGLLSQGGEGRLGGGRRSHLAAHALETGAERQADVLVVVDDEHAQLGPALGLAGLHGAHCETVPRAPGGRVSGGC